MVLYTMPQDIRELKLILGCFFSGEASDACVLQVRGRRLRVPVAPSGGHEAAHGPRAHPRHQERRRNREDDKSQRFHGHSRNLSLAPSLLEFLFLGPHRWGKAELTQPWARFLPLLCTIPWPINSLLSYPKVSRKKVQLMSRKQDGKLI